MDQSSWSLCTCSNGCTHIIPQNKHDDCGLVYSMNVAYLHKNAFLISISAPFFVSSLPSACASLLVMVVVLPPCCLLDMTLFPILPRSYSRQSSQRADQVRLEYCSDPRVVFGVARSHITPIHFHTTQTNLRLVPGSLCLFLMHALLLSSSFFSLFE